MYTLNKFTSARVLTRFALTAVAVFMMASAAEAGTITCPDSLDPGETRQVEIEWSDILYPTGDANCISDGAGNLPNSNPYLGYPLIVKDCLGDCAGLNISGSGDGSFTIEGALGDYLLGFKFGGGSGDPDWIVVQLINILSGTWDFIPDSDENALSHANLWGDPGDTPEIPEPASLLLIGTGLFGAAAARRRRAAKS